MDKEQLNSYLVDIHRCADEIAIVVAALEDFDFPNLAKRLEDSRAAIVHNALHMRCVLCDDDEHDF